MKKFAGIIAGVLSLLVLVLFRLFPKSAEQLYGGAVYPAIRFLFDYTLGLLPFAVIYLLPLILIAWLIYRLKESKGVAAKILVVLNVVGGLIAAFYLLWGYNYARPGLSERMVVNPIEISTSQLINFAERTGSELNDLRTPQLLQDIPSDAELEHILRNAVEKVVNEYGMQLNTTCRVRLLQPAGVLRKFGITGIYMPFTGEALLEKSHPQPEKIFVMAHELAHSFGVTDEGEANLVAYLACAPHPSSQIQYAGHLAMWEYLKYTLFRRNVDTGYLSDELSEMVIHDLNLLREERIRYREWVPNLGEKVNDTYLKLQGVEEGVAAYNSLPELYLQHRKEY